VTTGGGGPAPFTLSSSYGVLLLIKFELVAMPVRKAKKRGKYGGMPLKGYMKGGMKAGASSKQLAVMVNPFSTATTNPKIPDGLSTSSAGLWLQVAGLLDATLTQTIIHVLMHPGLPSGLITCLTPSTGDDNQLLTPTNSRFWPYANHFKLEVPEPTTRDKNSGSLFAPTPII
jgi:hypothetical protein